MVSKRPRNSSASNFASGSSTPARILIVARPGDEHADAVESFLRRETTALLRTSLTLLREHRLTWEPGGNLTLADGLKQHTIGPTTTVWWRRTGSTSVEDLEPAEAELVRHELPVILGGALLAQRVRWVDCPYAIERAENKLYQLIVAHKLGLPTPPTLITNSPESARGFAAGRRVVAKAVSGGPGLAPFVDRVPLELLERVAAAPTLLQEEVVGNADARVVTVADRVLMWSRRREPTDPPDWRACDPSGEQFRLGAAPALLESAATTLANALGLSMTVQDWLLSDSGPVFLEVNPQGQWLFLDGAEAVVVPVLARHLLGAA